MTIDKNFPGTHLSEHVAVHFGAKLESYARMGSSNFVIRLQIEEAIKQIKQGIELFDVKTRDE